MPKAASAKKTKRGARQRKRGAAQAGTMHAFLRPIPEPRSLLAAPAPSSPAPLTDFGHESPSPSEGDCVAKPALAGEVVNLDASEADEIESTSEPSPVALPVTRRTRAQAAAAAAETSALTLANSVLTMDIAPRSRKTAPLCCETCGAPTAVPERKVRVASVAPVVVESSEEEIEPASADVPEAPTAEPQRYSFRSRLSRRKMLAAHAKTSLTPLNEPVRPPIKVRIVLPKPPSSDVVDLVSPPKRSLRSDANESSPKRRRRIIQDESSSEQVVQPVQPPAKLHSFFKATQKAVIAKKSEPGTRKACAVAAHPWTSPWATVHVNGPPISEDVDEQWFESPPACTPAPDWSYLQAVYPRTSDAVIDVTKTESVDCMVKHTEEGRVSAWAEHYKDCESIDRVNSAAVTTLIDWLRAWYKGGGSPVESYSTNLSSSDSESDFRRMRETERIAILSGPSGSGKSTIVKIAARHLGLSVLEINQSVCRRGQKVKDIIGEALKTHRVTSNVQNSAFGKDGPKPNTNKSAQVGRAPRTLILFEEVDELHDDERGFWASLRELASASDCMRPIVCTANKFSVAMQGVFGSPALPEEDEETVRLLSRDVPEECLSPMDFKNIELEMRTPRQVCEVLRTVSVREKLGLKKEALVNISRSARIGDIRHAVNALQFWSTPSAVSPLPTSIFCIRSSIDFFCALDSELDRTAKLASFERLDDGEHTVLQTVYRATTSCLKEAASPNPEQDLNEISAISDVLDSFSLADQLMGAVCADDVDMSYSSVNDLQIEAKGFLGRDGASEIATQLNAHSLSSLRDALTDIDCGNASKIAVKDHAATDAKWFPELGVTATLSRRSTLSESVPALRTMMLTARRVRIRNASSDGTALSTGLSRRRQTRSQRRADHVLCFGLGDEATTLLERNCMKFKIA